MANTKVIRFDVCDRHDIFDIRNGIEIETTTAIFSFCSVCGRFCDDIRYVVEAECAVIHEEPCNCGDFIRHNDGGNYHSTVWKVVRIIDIYDKEAPQFVTAKDLLMRYWRENKDEFQVVGDNIIRRYIIRENLLPAIEYIEDEEMIDGEEVRKLAWSSGAIITVNVPEMSVAVDFFRTEDQLQGAVMALFECGEADIIERSENNAGAADS